MSLDNNPAVILDGGQALRKGAILVSNGWTAVVQAALGAALLALLIRGIAWFFGSTRRQGPTIAKPWLFSALDGQSGEASKMAEPEPSNTPRVSLEIIIVVSAILGGVLGSFVGYWQSREHSLARWAQEAGGEVFIWAGAGAIVAGGLFWLFVVWRQGLISTSRRPPD